MFLHFRLVQHRFFHVVTCTAFIVSLVLLGSVPPAQAGCGCSKPPPELAEVRPNVTYAGMEVSLFHASLSSGQLYTVTFTSGITGTSAAVPATAVTRRDLADGVVKPQVVVAVPAMPLGPTSISVADGSGTFMALADDAFTVAPQPLALPTQVGETVIPDFQAAVSRDGVVYLSLDVSAIQHPRTFTAQTLGYPLRFSHEDVIFANTQGFLMQLLGDNMPGLYAVAVSSGTPDSDTLQYARHEFSTHFLQHAERQAHVVDPSDPNWHLDGTPHIDHDHLIVAIAGMLHADALPAPGATPPADLVVNTYTLFHHGLFGDAYVDIKGSSTGTGSYNSQDGSFGSEGDILSNGDIILARKALVDGDATGFAFDISKNSTVSGDTLLATTPTEFMPVVIPTGLEDLGEIHITDGSTLSLGPGSYQVSWVALRNNSQLYIDNTEGPVTLYITGHVTDEGELIALRAIYGSMFTVADPNPEKFAVYVASGEVIIKHEGAFYGLIYAPESLVRLRDGGEFFGSFVGHEVKLRTGSQVYFDTALRGE